MEWSSYQARAPQPARRGWRAEGRHGLYVLAPVFSRSRTGRRLKRVHYKLTISGRFIANIHSARLGRAWADAYDELTDRAERRSFLRDGAAWCYRWENEQRVRRAQREREAG